MAASPIVHTVGRRLKNQVWNGTTARPTTLWLGLRTLDGASGHPSDAAAADTMTSNLAEVSGGGYARPSITFNNTNAPESLTGDGLSSVLTFAQQTFTFTGTITGITHSFLCTGANATDTSGVLIESAPLGTTRNVTNSDQIKVTFLSTMAQG